MVEGGGYIIPAPKFIYELYVHPFPDRYDRTEAYSKCHGDIIIFRTHMGLTFIIVILLYISIYTKL